MSLPASHSHPVAPELAVSQWFNADGPLSLAELRGEVVVIDRAGHLRAQAFGQHDDLALGALLGRLLDEPEPDRDIEDCSSDGCIAPTTAGPGDGG